MNDISCRKYIEFSPEEMTLDKRGFQYQGCSVKSAEFKGISDCKHTHLHLHLWKNIFEDVKIV